MIPALARQYRVLALDLPGFEDTPAPPERMSLSTLGLYLRGFLGALGVERATLAGNSLGGAVVIRHVARDSGCMERLFLLNSAGLLYDAHQALEPRDRERARALIELVTAKRSRSPGLVLDSLTRRAEPTDVKDVLSRLSVPTTVIWGDRDRWIPPDHGEALHSAVAGSELLVLEIVGHVPRLHAPRELARLLLGRLR